MGDKQEELIDAMMRATDCDLNNVCLRNRMRAKLMNNKKNVLTSALGISVISVIPLLFLYSTGGLSDWPVFGMSSPNWDGYHDDDGCCDDCEWDDCDCDCDIDCLVM